MEFCVGIFAKFCVEIPGRSCFEKHAGKQKEGSKKGKHLAGNVTQMNEKSLVENIRQVFRRM